MKDFLFEIQCEEIPARFQAMAKRLVLEKVTEKLKQKNETEVYVTPRRIALWIKDVLSDQESELEPLCQDLMKIKWPKSMRWHSDTTWVRPVRGFMALYGKDVFSWSWEGLKADRFTMPHRLASNVHKIKLHEPKEYPSLLRESGIEPCFEKRMSSIQEQVQQIAAQENCQVYPGDFQELLNENAGLTQWPVAVLGHFDESFLRLPTCVIVCVLQKHQRCFSLVKKDGSLAPLFIMISDGVAAKSLHGYETVVRARLSDGLFFWEKDRKQTLEGHRESLKERGFFEGLGSLWDKTERMASMAQHLGPLLGLDQDQLKQSAQLSKSDTVTSMVQEFPVLQGAIGHIYAVCQGICPVLAQSLSDQYKVHTAEPVGKLGAGLAILEALDTLVGFFTLGKRSSGSGDPLALRRTAHGLLRAMDVCAIDLDFVALAHKVLQAYHGQGYLCGQPLPEDFMPFLKDRWIYLLRDRHIDKQDLKKIFKEKNFLLEGRTQAELYTKIKREVPEFLTSYHRLNQFLKRMNASETTHPKKDFSCLPQQEEQNIIALLERPMDIDQMSALWLWAKTLADFFEKVYVVDPEYKDLRVTLLLAVYAKLTPLSFLNEMSA